MTDRTPAAADARHAASAAPEAEVPEGIYCYTRVDGKMCVCPFWAIDTHKPEQMNGYCALLGEGDWQDEGPSLLWDMCKECGLKDDIDFDPEIIESPNQAQA